jgi:hypothetical protein
MCEQRMTSEPRLVSSVRFNLNRCGAQSEVSREIGPKPDDPILVDSAFINDAR